MKRSLFSIICLLFFLQLTAGSQQTNIDSLQKIIKSTQDSTHKFNALLQLYKSTKNEHPQQADAYASEALAIARKMGDKLKESLVIKETSKLLLANYQFEQFDSIVHAIIPVFEDHNETELLADCYNNLGTSQFYRGNVVKAEEYYHQALALYDPDSWPWASTRLNTVFLMQTQGRYSEALPILLQLTKKFKALEDEYNYTQCLVTLASVYETQGDFEKSREYNLQYIEKCKAIGFQDGIAGGYHNLANLASKQENHQEALKYALKAVEGFKKPQMVWNKASSMLTLGIIYHQLGQLDKALQTNEEILTICKEKGINSFLSEIYNNNSNIYLEKGAYQTAFSWAKKSLQEAEKNREIDMIRDASYNLYEASKALGKTDDALAYHELHHQYKDSLLQEQNSKAIRDLKNNFEITIKEYENQQLKQENTLNDLEIKQQRTKLWVVAVILILVSVIVFVLILLNRKLRSKNRVISEHRIELEKNNRLKDNMFSIIAHDLRGPMGATKGLLEFLDIDSAREDQKGYEDVLETVKKSASSTYELLENLLNWSRQQKNEITFEPKSANLTELVDEIMQLKQPAAKRKNIHLSHSLQNEFIVKFDKNMIHLVIRNLIDNAIKFTPEGGKVDILGEIKEEKVQIAVADTGVGISEEAKVKIFDKYQLYSSKGTKNEHGSGLGLKLCHDFIQKHSGSIYVESKIGEGSRFIFTVPQN
ncbi:MAG: tetratricopeptide repeat protein [Bacteroidetes bacterium]|nr:tetratricopeptide repeat protein [Bacteroidota bacterium]